MSEGTSVVVRRAEVEDTAAVVTVLRRSITELCVADHGNDPGVLGAWLENKTAEKARSWIESPRNCMLVAEVGGAVCGVASLSLTGGILLCYLLPEVKSTGVGRAMLEGLEAEARRLGIRELSLESTASARGFYMKQGFQPKEGGSADSALLFKMLVS